MKLGIIITTDLNLRHLTGVVEETLKRGHEVRLFVMDRGSMLLEDAEFQRLCNMEGLEASFCALNATENSVDTERVAGYITSGSQYNNAGMANWADKVLNL